MMRSSRKLNSLFTRALSSPEKGKGYIHLECSEIDAGGVLLLMDAASRTSRLGWEVRVGGEGDGWKNLLEHINHYLTPKEDRSSKYSNATFLLRDLNNREEMVQELEKWARSVQDESAASDEEVASWQFQISEVVTNSFQHSRSEEPMLLAGRVDNSRSVVNLAAMDFGLTIPTTIGRHPHCPGGKDTDGKRILFACRHGITARSERANQGRGLFDLVETVKKNGGTMQILSGNGLFHLSSNRRCCRNLRAFKASYPILEGTLVSVSLRI